MVGKEGPQEGIDSEVDDDDDLPEPPRPWSAPAELAAAVLWPSFLAACAATMLFFAIVDPGQLYHATTPPLDISRMTGYGIGFFFFWIIAAASSAVSVFLLRTRHGRDNADSGRNPRP